MGKKEDAERKAKELFARRQLELKRKAREKRAACPRCGGSGHVWVTSATGPDHRKACPACGGTGKVK